MGKGEELWDDSALINAFDDAIFKYKKMHGKGCKKNSSDVTGVVESSNGYASTVIDANQDNKSSQETVDGGDNDASHATLEVGEVEISETTEANEVSVSKFPKEPALGSSSPFIEDQAQNNSSSLTVDEYTKLYEQYYEVEEQRQKILQKMQQFSGWNDMNAGEASVSGLQWGTNAATQEYQSTTSQAPCGAMVVSCCSCACACPMTSCSSLPCPSAGPCVGTLSTAAPAPTAPGKLPGDEDVEFVKMAMGAAERAISSLKDKTSAADNICRGKEQSVSSETDLSVVLNAWYSAGLYTGKYLTEQSLAKKRHG